MYHKIRTRAYVSIKCKLHSIKKNRLNAILIGGERQFATAFADEITRTPNFTEITRTGDFYLFGTLVSITIKINDTTGEVEWTSYLIFADGIKRSGQQMAVMGKEAKKEIKF